MNLLTSAKTLRIPYEDDQLRQTAQFLIQRQEEIIQQKLLRQQLKQSKIKKLQDDFEKWALTKQRRIQQKLQKSQKNKFQIISKIVKKCQQNDKLYNSKIKTVFTKKRQSLKDAWKAVQKYNQQTENFQKNKNFISTGQKMRTATQEEIKNHSIMLQDKNDEKGVQNISSLNIKNTSKLMEASHLNHNNNKSMVKNDGGTFLTNSIYFPNQYEKNVNKQVKNNTKIQMEIQNQEEQQQRKAYEQRYRQNMLRHQRHIQSLESRNIQDLGERLYKIQKSRIKRHQMSKSRFKKDRNHENGRQNTTQNQRNYHSSSKNIKKQRLKSQSYTMEKRVKDWSEHNKQKREEMLEAHIQYGNHYLYENKIKYLKTVLAKNVALQGIQKKLYIERLKH